MTSRQGVIVDTTLYAGSDSRDDFPIAETKELQGAVQPFATIAQRDAWTKAYPSRLKDSYALVTADSNGYPSLFRWTGSAWAEVDLRGGIILADANGALMSTTKTLVLGEGFSIQKAGDQESGALVSFNSPAGDGSITVSQSWGKKSSVNNVAEIIAQYPIEFIKGKDGQASVTVKQGIYAKAKNPDWLGYLKSNHTVAGKSVPVTQEIHDAGKLAFKNIVVDNTGPYIHMDSAGQKFTIQQTNESDPNVTGGTDFLVSLRLSLEGRALADGSLLIYLYDDSINPYDKDTYLIDKNGEPLIAAKHYKQGDLLGDLDIAGIVNAEGMKSFTCHVVSSMAGFVTLNDRFHGGTCLLVQDVSGKNQTGDAVMQFELDTNDKLWYEDDGTSYNLKASIPGGVTRGAFTQKYEAFIQSTDGSYGLRYSIPLNDSPMPCGKATKGHADVVVDPSVNQIAGSAAGGGEGAIKFTADGNVDIATTLRLNNSTDSKQTVTFWWSSVAADGTVTKIPESADTITLLPKVYRQELHLPTFSKLVQSGDRIILTAKSSVAVGVYLETNVNRYPLLETTVSFKELQPFGEYENV